MVKDVVGLLSMQLNVCKVAGFCVFLAGFLLYGTQTACLIVIVSEKWVYPLESPVYGGQSILSNQSIVHSTPLGICHDIQFLNIYLLAMTGISLSLALHYGMKRLISKIIALGWVLECIFVFILQSICMIGLCINSSSSKLEFGKGVYIWGEVCKEPIVYHVNLFIITFILLAMFYKISVLGGAKNQSKTGSI